MQELLRCLWRDGALLRGTSVRDGQFITYMALSKRREHGTDTWIMYIDLVQAFDTAIHELVYEILRKYGVPEAFDRSHFK